MPFPEKCLDFDDIMVNLPALEIQCLFKYLLYVVMHHLS